MSCTAKRFSASKSEKAGLKPEDVTEKDLGGFVQVQALQEDKVNAVVVYAANEPVQFYTSKAKQPYELVVNQVKKDQIVGYLATPKEQIAR